MDVFKYFCVSFICRVPITSLFSNWHLFEGAGVLFIVIVYDRVRLSGHGHGFGYTEGFFGYDTETLNSRFGRSEKTPS